MAILTIKDYKKMRKLIALLIALSLCFSSCTLLEEYLGDYLNSDVATNTTPNTGGIHLPPIVNNPKEPAPDNGTDGCKDDKHTDLDDNGTCDYCSVSVIVVVDMFALNDLHGKISPSSTQYGIGGLTTYLMTEADENSIFISSGDMWQGTAESGLSFGAIMTEWMNDVGFVSMTIGNHEYDWSEQSVLDNNEIAEFPFLAINVYDKTTNRRADYATPSIVVERDGVEIGIIGAIGDCYSSISGDVAGNFTFKVGSELTKLVKEESDRLRAEGVDFIVYSIHDGYGSSSSGVQQIANSSISSYYDVSLSNGYVDLVFEAHTHQSYILKDSHGVYHLQGGGENSGLSRVEININSANGSSSVNDPTIVKSSAWQNLPTHSIVTDLLAKYSDDIAKANERLGYNSAYRSDAVLEQIVADLYYQFGVETWGDKYNITLGGGFIRTRSPYNLVKGDVYYSSIYSLFTFNNDLVLCTISGQNLLNKFINTTNKDYYIAAGVDINTLKNSIDPNKTYYVVVDTYTSSYKYNYLTEVARVSGVYARDLLAEYVKEGGLS